MSGLKKGSSMLQQYCFRRMLLTSRYRQLPSRKIRFYLCQGSHLSSTPPAGRRGRCSIAHAAKKGVDPSSNGAAPELIERIEERDLQKEASDSYLAYAMSVVVGRALPDVRDGLKPAHRRIIYAMHELGLTSKKPHKKCARVVGEVLGKFHPHGDSAVYQALVRMAQDFSMRAPLVSGHGNFGSIDNDPAAAMRYTECRLEPISMDMLLSQLGKNSVDFIPTFDGSMTEPTVLPAKVPNILVNGSSGIAVGMATNMPPHNLSEVINALKLLIDNPDVTIQELLVAMPGPDFPTGGEIVLKQRLQDTYITGKGSVLMRGKVSIEGEEGGQKKKTKITKRGSTTTQSIIITELPYQTCKADLVEAIAGLVEDHTIQGISDVRDESDREGIRIVVDVKRGNEPQIVLNNLYKRTKLEISFSCNMVALVNGVPKTMNLKQILEEFLNFRCTVATRRARFELKEIDERLHIVEGFIKAMKSMEKIIDTIRKAHDSGDARSKLTSLFDLSTKQASSILDLPLARLTSIETKKLQGEQKDLMARRLVNEGLLKDREKLLMSIQKEITEVQKNFGDARRSVIIEDPGDLSDMDVVANEPNLVVFSKNGFIKRMKPNTFVARKRGGVGVYGTNLRQDDSMGEIAHVMLHDQLLFFTESGIVYSLRSYQIPMASRTAMGTPIAQVLPKLQNDQITRIMALDSMDPEKDFLLMLTEDGLIKRTPCSSFKNVRANGLIAIKVREDDKLKWVGKCSEDMSIFIAASTGNTIRFPVNQENLLPRSRTARGIKAMKVKGSQIVGLEVLPPNLETPAEDSSSSSASNSSRDEEALGKTCVLIVTAKGLGKRVPIQEFRLQRRGGVGTKGLKLNSDDRLVVAMPVGTDPEKSELVIASEQGMVTRTSISAIPVYKRFSKGVKVMNLKKGDFVKDVTATVIDQQELDSLEESAVGSGVA